jgi:outer membrane lipoprotein SlyB
MRIATACAATLLVAGCASTSAPEIPTVVRTRPPVSYENTITNYFDLKIRGPQPNRVLTIGKPEAGGCPLGGQVTSALGWVVPVQYATRSGALTGKDAGIDVKGKEYYFWFRQDTLYGVTPRMELCP